MRLVARHEHDARALTEQRQRCIEHRELRVAVELQRVVFGHAALHAAGGVEHENVKPPELALHLGEHRGKRLGIGEIGALHERAHAELAQLGRELFSAGRLVAKIHHDIGTSVREVADRVGADATRRTGDEGALACEAACCDRLSQDVSL